ncbi:DUF5719 family protein [Bifidobacterium aquikefiricola]|uniref:DUF5719 family protein n=1 Tax=Bifidobacterium aquikefiricola TaxID=3059038 RepID=A0AB39U3Z9_9BIFI
MKNNAETTHSQHHADQQGRVPDMANKAGHESDEHAALSSSSRGRSISKIALASLSALVVLAMMFVLVAIEPAQGKVDSDNSGSAMQTHAVTQHTIMGYCPSRMSLADSGNYGDSQFQASAGDISSDSAHAAFGAIYDSSITAFPNNDGTALATQLEDKDPTNDAAVSIAQSDVNAHALVQNTQLLDTKSGAGAASSVVSQATQGDLRGLSATSCVSPALSQSFLLPATDTGWTQQLVIANPTDKATAISFNVWGTVKTGTLALNTARTVTIGAGSESVYDLAAAAPQQDGLFVTVASKDTAVAAVVKVVGLDGLKSLGSEYVTATGSAAQSMVLPGVTKGQHVKLLAYAESASKLSISWVTKAGLKNATSQSLEAHRVASIDMGSVPDDAMAVSVTADNDIHASAITTVDGSDGQQDFGVIAAQSTPQFSAIALPKGLGGSLVLANRSTQEASADIDIYNADGARLETKTVQIGPNAASSLALSDLGSNIAAITVQQQASSKNALSWDIALSSSTLDDAKIAASSYLQPVSLMLQHARITVNETVGVLR